MILILIYFYLEFSRYLIDAILNFIILVTGTSCCYQWLSKIIIEEITVGRIYIITNMTSLLIQMQYIYNGISKKNYLLIPITFDSISFPSYFSWIIYGILIKDFYISLDEGLTAKEILFDSNFSGSTCILLFQIGNYLISSNVGDSRAIMIKENNEIIELSLDQKPENENEKKRILKMGGVISQCNDLYDDGKEGGPFRIWVKGCDYPGIAMSRSIGDKIAHDIGVISEPEILDFNLDDKCKYLIMGSDGVWQYLKNENVVEIISPFLEEKMLKKLLKKLLKNQLYLGLKMIQMLMILLFQLFF